MMANNFKFYMKLKMSHPKIGGIVPAVDIAEVVSRAAANWGCVLRPLTY